MDENPYQSPQVPDPQQTVENIPQDGKHCPACGEDIGIWPIASAVVPGRCRCPHCQTRLTWNGAYRATLVMLVLTLAFAGGAYLVLRRLGIEDRTYMATVFMALALPPTLIMSWLGHVPAEPLDPAEEVTTAFRFMTPLGFPTWKPAGLFCCAVRYEQSRRT